MNFLGCLVLHPNSQWRARRGFKQFDIPLVLFIIAFFFVKIKVVRGKHFQRALIGFAHV
jgi:hypothetical protein